MSRSLEERVADLDRGIRAQLKARAIPRRQVVLNPTQAARPITPAVQQPIPTIEPRDGGRAVDWSHAPIARFVREQTRVRLLKLVMNDETPRGRISLEERRPPTTNNRADLTLFEEASRMASVDQPPVVRLRAIADADPSALICILQYLRRANVAPKSVWTQRRRRFIEIKIELDNLSHEAFDRLVADVEQMPMVIAAVPFDTDWTHTGTCA